VAQLDYLRHLHCLLRLQLIHPLHSHYHYRYHWYEATEALNSPCWAVGVANAPAGKSETNTTGNATAILQWCSNSRSYEGNYLGFLDRLNLIAHWVA
jgi:hypothetical protein